MFWVKGTTTFTSLNGKSEVLSTKVSNSGMVIKDELKGTFYLSKVYFGRNEYVAEDYRYRRCPPRNET